MTENRRTESDGRPRGRDPLIAGGCRASARETRAEELMMEPERLSSFALFEGLTDDEMARCASTFQEVDLLSDHNVAREGDDAYAFFVVLDGELDVHHDFTRVATLRPGDFFGEVGLESTGKRTAHVASRGRVRLAKQMAWDYTEMIRAHPLVHERIAAAIAARSPRG
jgi:CRP-like cAMP-binding protein